jgi:hypothetical protein
MDLIEKINAVMQQADRYFSVLSKQQLNWRPETKKWSIAQCLEHLLNTNKTYFPGFDKILAGTHKLGFFQKLNPFKKMVGAYMIKQLGPLVKKKMKAPAIFQPSHSEVPADIVSRFLNQQKELVNYFLRLHPLQTTRINIASPVTPFIVYSLSDAMKIIAGHEQRHLNQALDVLNHTNFPK